MKFLMEVEVTAKRNTGKVLDGLIERASSAVMRDARVKVVDIKGRAVPEEGGDAE